MVQSSSDYSVDSERKKETKEERLLRKAKAYVEREERRKRKKRKRKSEHEEQKRTKRHSKKSHDHDERDQKDKRIPDSKRSRRDADDKEQRRKHKKRSKESTKERKSGKRASYDQKPKTQESELCNLGVARGRPPAQALDDKKDYFVYHQHLWVYLHHKEGLVFGDLSSSEARDAFGRFVKKYNAGSLETAYYGSVLPSEALESVTTRHRWNFKTNDTERNNLNLIEEGVRKQTDYQKEERLPVDKGERAPPKKNKLILESFGNSHNSNTRTGKRPEERLAEKIANQRLREHAKVAEEEFSGGRREGHERLLEKRKEQAASIHGAARDREESRVGVEMQDSDIYCGGSNDFAVALERERQRKQQRGERKEARVKELEQKERDRQEEMLKSLGLSGIKPGQKIKIRPRDDL